ncbi:UDP-N-acetylmuramoyl-tripeptide--D-alanyl-D-alanine ligase [Ramlibacter sp. AN1015]|uniref:UDP-N-acetylmuramoyl-tripeptide--D-alanyl-D- alanine ligase n=1 Tax=Ramlibacter sp. AN1015 TaxID=3133428 RepID=UPI0030C57E22
MCTLQQALGWIDGGRLVGNAATTIARVHTDTRSLQAGDLFVALRGERFDANDMLADAAARGATAVLAHRGRIPPGVSGIEVDDTRLALGQLARGWRSQFELPLIAVTGSNGKTTVTQMVASILRAWQGEASLATQGNFNNDIGLPLTLLRLRAAHRVAVLELGMNHPGEIAYLAGIARPSVALVNNAQREHQEFMATVEAVARENGAVVESLGAQGIAVFPQEDVYAPLWREMAGTRRCITFGAAAHAGADLFLAGSEWHEGHWRVRAQTPAGPVEFRLHIAGRHNVGNALAAAACALAAGAPLHAVAQGLEAFEPVKGRSRALPLQHQGRTLTLVDDSYNANPDSVRAAIDVLAELPGPQLLVLGDMGEVGNQGPQFHAEVGDYARERGIQHLFTLGEQARGMRGQHFESHQALVAAAHTLLPQLASILVKGSRFMRMEQVVQGLAQAASPDASPVTTAATTTTTTTTTRGDA